MSEKMNQKTIVMLEAFAAMETTSIIATELDKVIEEVDNVNGEKELVAAVLIAAMRCGKCQIQMLDTQ